MPMDILGAELRDTIQVQNLLEVSALTLNLVFIYRLYFTLYVCGLI